MHAITSKLEINVERFDISLVDLNNLAIQCRSPVVVVGDAAAIPQLTQIKYGSRSQYKIILAVDFPHGHQYVLDKFKNLDPSFQEADGFDILITPGKSQLESRNEINILRDFLLNINPICEVRFVLDMFTRTMDETENALKALKDYPATMVRIDHHLALPDRHTAIENYKKQVDIIRRYTGAPIKASGNIGLENIYDLVDVGIHRFDVSHRTARNIIKELNAAAAVASERFITPRVSPDTPAIAFIDPVENDILEIPELK